MLLKNSKNIQTEFNVVERSLNLFLPFLTDYEMLMRSTKGDSRELLLSTVVEFLVVG